MEETMTIQSFLRGDLGQIITFIFAASLFFLVVGGMFKKMKLGAKAMAYAGLAMSIAFMLSFLTIFRMPWGGSITPMSMFFVSLIGFMFGPVVGIVSGVAYGLLQLVQRASVVHPIQLILDYPMAFGALGLSGFFWKAKNGLYIGFVVAVIGRWAMHTLAGVVFFGQWAWEGWNPLPYSMAYNAAYIVPEMVITLIILVIPPVRHAIERVRAEANKV
ncbi:MAG: energy-coupled thiamine transporter ThiT [Defluviitaleaceae bacterium]|nr:energy-coupled thiamine transporter ThiT [Defluviitaleaceae bacterium]